MIVFEQIGLVASIGLCQALVTADEETPQGHFENAVAIADALAALLRNNPASGSPRLDEHVIDVTLGLLLLVSAGYTSQAQDWLTELVKRADYTFKCKRNFPISTDSTDDLIETTVFGDEELRTRLMTTSWLLPTLAAWSVVLRRDDLYGVIAKHSKTEYPEVCLQLWHPTQDLYKHLYYWPAHYHCGESEAPINLPDTADEFRSRMKAVLESSRHDVISSSPASMAGIVAIDFVACRHFRTPIAPFVWYRFLDAPIQFHNRRYPLLSLTNESRQQRNDFVACDGLSFSRRARRRLLCLGLARGCPALFFHFPRYGGDGCSICDLDEGAGPHLLIRCDQLLAGNADVRSSVQAKHGTERVSASSR